MSLSNTDIELISDAIIERKRLHKIILEKQAELRELKKGFKELGNRKLAEKFEVFESEINSVNRSLDNAKYNPLRKAA